MGQKLLFIDCYNTVDSIDEFIIFDMIEGKIYDGFEEQSLKKNNPIKENPICKIKDENMYEDYLTLYNENGTYIINDQQFKIFLEFTSSHITSLKQSTFLKQYSLEEWLI
jgi:hypothetical protein